MKRLCFISDLCNKIEKIVSFSSLLLIIISFIVIIRTPCSSGYEISIYEMYPTYFWFLLLFSFLGGQFILVKNSIYCNNSTFSGVFGIVIILLADFILISIPILRNYIIFGRADVLSHIGLVLDILNSGFVGPSNSYPIIHILSAQLTLITGMNRFMPPQLIPAVYSLLHLMLFYILARLVSRERGELLLILAFAFIPVFNISISQIVSYSVFAPYSQLILIFPLFVYVFLNVIKPNSNYNYRLLLIILIFYCVFAHPLSGIAVIVMFLVWDSLVYIYKLFKPTSNYNIRSSKNFILLYIIAFSLWGAYIYLLINSVSRIFYSILGIDKRSELNQYVDLTNKLNPDFSDLVRLFMTIYGQAAITSLLLIIALYYIFFKEKRNNDNYLFFVFPISICGFIFLCISLVLIFASSFFPVGRFFAWVFLFSPLIIPHAIYTYLTKTKIQGRLHSPKKFVKIIILGFILFLISYFSIFNIYASPIVLSSNQQVTASELVGMEWLFDFVSMDLPILEMGIGKKRIRDALYGHDIKRDTLTGKMLLESNPIENHFGYDKYFKINYSSSYLVLNYIGKNLYPDIYGKNFGNKYRDKWRFYPEDFIKLGLDPNVNSIYSNGNLDAYILT